MKKIVPFNNVLTFNTDVSEITAISLEHNITKEKDTISGVFYITGEYKITDGVIGSDKFSFELPFDIALGNEYDLSTLDVDIDDFRYELVDRDKLKVNIDLYIDGDIIEHPIEIEEEVVPSDEELFTDKELKQLKEDDSEELPSCSDVKEEENRTQETSNETEEEHQEDDIESVEERVSLLDQIDENDEVKEMEEEKIEINNDNENNNINIFSGFNEEEKYVTYHVYPVGENDTLDRIMERYNVTKEELAKYNNIEDIKVGDKLIIPANDK